MKLKVFHLLKFYSNRKYAEDFLDGKLHINTIRYFRDNGYDENEGTREVSVKDAVFRIKDANDEWVTIPNLISFNVQSEEMLDLHAFCIYARHTGDVGPKITEQNLEEMKKQLRIDDEVIETYGNHTVVITDLDEFRSRFLNGVKGPQYRLRCGFVTYYDKDDPPVGNDMFELMSSPFYKRRRFEKEREYRFVIHTDSVTHKPSDSEADEPLCLNLGDMRDIAFYIDGREINDLTEVSPN